MSDPAYDMTFIGHFTKDTIITPSGTRTANGGGFIYGSNVAERMGLRTAASTFGGLAEPRNIMGMYKTKT